MRLLPILLICLAAVSADFVFDTLRGQQRDIYHSCDYTVLGSGGGGAIAAGKLVEELSRKVVCLLENGVDYLNDPHRDLAEYLDNLVELSRTRIFAKTILSVAQAGLINPPSAKRSVIGLLSEKSIDMLRDYFSKQGIEADRIEEIINSVNLYKRNVEQFPPTTPRIIDDWVGNATGGGGTVNSMGYRRPQKFVFDLLNKPGWSYAEALAAYEEIESRVNITKSSVTYSIVQSLMSTAFAKSGYPAQSSPLDDIRGHWQSYWTTEQRSDGVLVRTSSYLSYVVPNLISAPNGNRLLLFPQTRADKLINIKTLRGVRNIGVLARNSVTDKIVLFGVQKRVLIAAGVYSTPQLLMLSGIGPKALLQNLGIVPRVPFLDLINPLVDLPVGQNFWSHTNLQTIHLPNISYVAGFTQTVNRKNNMFGSGPVNSQQTGYIIGLSTIFIEEFFPYLPIGFSEIITTNVSSRGVITLNSTNPRQQPVIDHRLLTHPADIEAVKRSFSEFRKVMAQPEAVDAYNQELAPGLDIPTEGPMAEFYIRSAAGVAHTGGGCHIGAVVDEGLRVKGTTNVHICDMSVYPNPVGVNTYSTAMLAGYQCARFIIEEDA